MIREKPSGGTVRGDCFRCCGDPHRELELDGRAVTGFADELDTADRRAQLQAALRDLHEQAEGLPRAAFLLEALLEDEDLAWRSLAVALLAEQLDEDAD